MRVAVRQNAMVEFPSNNRRGEHWELERATMGEGVMRRVLTRDSSTCTSLLCTFAAKHRPFVIEEAKKLVKTWMDWFPHIHRSEIYLGARCAETSRAGIILPLS